MSGGGDLVEANPKIGRVFSQRRMAYGTPLGPEFQFLDSFMTIRAMVEEMYNEFKKGNGEGTSSPKPNKGAEEPFLFIPPDKEDKGKGEKPHHHRHHHRLLLINLVLLRRRKRNPL